MKVDGRDGSIVILEADWKALSGLIVGALTPDKIFEPNAAGHALLETV